MRTMLDAALEFAAMELAVFPLVERDKLPAVSGGFKVATTDEEQIREAWGHRPNLNIGIATGTVSRGLVVIDLDVDDSKDEDGVATLRAWEREHGELPETATVKTGRGGMHLYYRCDQLVGCSVNSEIGVDVRGDGGYVVAPPSVHPNGSAYEFEEYLDDVPIARADSNVYAFIRAAQGERQRGRRFSLPEVIGDGKRNDTLMRLACSLQAQGFDDMLILANLEAVNSQKCVPPLPAEEVRAIVESVASRYEKGNAKPRRDGRGGAPSGVSLMLGGNGKAIQSIENCQRVLAADPALSGRFYYDVRAYTKMVSCPVPWDKSAGDRPISDADYCGLAAYLEREYGLMSKNKAIDAVVCVTNDNKRNTVTEWLDSLEWDGRERIMTLLPLFLGCDMSDYNVEVMRLFMLGAVARAYEPGAKFDYMPVLVGPQGIGKSYFLRMLGTRSEWYCDNLSTIEGDAATEKLRGMWIIELAELLATRRSKDVEGIKAFITSTVDVIRPKYGRETEQRARACVFAGTTNDMQFLTDATGNRRFLPVECGVHPPAMSLFADDAPAYFEQAWAEAVRIYKTERPRLVLSTRAQEYALEKQETFLEDDPRVGIIQEYLDGIVRAELGKADPDPSRIRVCAQEIIDRALPEQYTRGGAAALGSVNAVHKIMRNRISGWVFREGKARCGEYGVQRCYVPDPSATDGFAERMATRRTSRQQPC